MYQNSKLNVPSRQSHAQTHRIVVDHLRNVQFLDSKSRSGPQNIRSLVTVFGSLCLSADPQLKRNLAVGKVLYILSATTHMGHIAGSFWSIFIIQHLSRTPFGPSAIRCELWRWDKLVVRMDGWVQSGGWLGIYTQCWYNAKMALSILALKSLKWYMFFWHSDAPGISISRVPTFVYRGCCGVGVRQPISMDNHRSCLGILQTWLVASNL